MIRLLAGLFSFLALGAIAAVAGVALIFWLYDRDLPSHESLASYEPATLSRVYSGEGRLIAEFARERRIFTPYEEIPDIVKAAFISAEDKNFYNHPGIDATGVARAVWVNLQALRSGSGGLQGGSTITQQVVKNFLLTSDRSIERKIKEAILTLRIERALSKDRILELYLNEIFLGQNAYGVAAAAQRYFGKTLEDLTFAEAAYLAALPQAPSALHPVRHRERAEGRRNYVLREMFQNGVISETDMLTAQAEPLRTLFDGGVEMEVAAPERPNYFTEEIRRQLSQRMGSDALLGGGLTIRATIDPDLQRAAETALRTQLLAYDREQGGYGGPVARIDGVNLEDVGARRAAMASTALPRDIPGWRPALVVALTDAGATVAVEGGEETAELAFADVRGWTRRRGPNGELGSAPQGPGDVWQPGDVVMVEQDGDRLVMRQIPEVQGAFMAMEIETGRVLAMQGGFSYDSSVFNRATQAQRQPGSSFKPFIYAAALEQGYTPASVILDAPVVLRTGGSTWRPQNSSGRFYGPSPMRIGLELSRNLMTVRLAQAVGMDTVAGYAERFGVYDDMPEHLSFALGAGETTLMRMVAAYAMFANGGQLIAPTLIDRIQDRRGETIWRHDARICVGCGMGYDPDAPAPQPLPTGEQVMDPITAYQITSMLRGAVTRGTASRPFSGVQAVVAGKTGTTNDARDVWFVGYSPTIAFGCYIGFDSPRPLGRGAFGGTLCAPMVAEFVRAAYAERPWGDFEVPGGVEFINVDRWTGRPGGGETVAEVFRVGQRPGEGGMVIGGDGDFYFDGDDFPMSLDDGAPLADATLAPIGQSGGQGAGQGGGAPRPPAPAINGGFAAPGGLY
jgi:penicillin-binding protein 1A